MAVVLSLIFTSNLYADETLTAQQKEAEEWLKKGILLYCIDSPTLAIRCYTKAIELNPQMLLLITPAGLPMVV